MNELYLMISIDDRAGFPEFVGIYESEHLMTNFVSLGYGTATNEWVSLLGLSSKEKAICYTVITDEVWKRIKKKIREHLWEVAPGKGGLSCIIPISSFAGKRELMFLTDGQNYVMGEESVLKDTKQELIVVVCNQGYNEMVMEAARSVGAGGGTFFHSKGTGMQQARQFLGISLATEKDIIYIVTKKENKNAIMQAIINKAGMNSRANSIIFSLPVTDTVGIPSLEEPEE